MTITIESSLSIQEEIIEIENPPLFKWAQVFESIQTQVKNIQKIQEKYIIKCNLVKSTENNLYFNVVYIEDFQGLVENPFMPTLVPGLKPAITANEISCLIIPTGVGASFGGYAGDANPLAKILASKSKYLLTHPNVVNGAVLTDVPNNLIYLEGFLLDQFLSGKINLIQERKNKIGVIFDKGIAEDRLNYEVNVLNACHSFYGCNIVGWTLTEKPLNILPAINEFGFSTGSIKNLESVIEKALFLKEQGATAIAICCAIPDLELNKEYNFGKGIDPIGGIESIISHAVSAATGLVSAHAPALISNEKVDYKKISPQAASEYIAQTFLPSVISGLRFAPKIVNNSHSNSLSFNNLTNIIVPYNAFGSAGVLHSNEILQNVILIKENKTCLNTDPNHLKAKFQMIDNYVDLIGMQKILEEGIDPLIFQRPVKKVQEV